MFKLSPTLRGESRAADQLPMEYPPAYDVAAILGVADYRTTWPTADVNN